jgi:hypothetical protein
MQNKKTRLSMLAGRPSLQHLFSHCKWSLLLSMSLLAPAIFHSGAIAQQSHVLPLQFGAPVVGKPFSGTRTLDYEPAEGSPDPVAFHAEESIFRDSEGRTRSEIKYPGRLTTIDIIDFVSHQYFQWTVGDTVAFRRKFPEVAPQSTTAEKLASDAPLIEGVPTRHVRSVTGKDKVEKIVESWYSPDLSLAMVTIIDQPGAGKTTYRFVHVSRTEPDATLFRVPAGMTIEDADVTPPPPSPVIQGTTSSAGPLAGKTGLPHAIEDDNYLEALARFHAAVPRWLPSGSGYHRHTDVRMIDLYGKETTATVDHWQKGELGRDEEQASGWHYTTVWGISQNWSTHEGISPLHLVSLSDLTPRPGPAERRIRIYATGYVAMKQQEIDGVVQSCSEEYAGAQLCFDVSTGFPISARVDDERTSTARLSQAAWPSIVAVACKWKRQPLLPR